MEYIFWVSRVFQGKFEILELTLCKVNADQIIFESKPPFVIPLQKVRAIQTRTSGGAVPAYSLIELVIEKQGLPVSIVLAHPFVPWDWPSFSGSEMRYFWQLVNALVYKQPVPAIEPNPYVRQYPEHKDLIVSEPSNGWDPYLSPYIVFDRYFKKANPITWRDLLSCLLIFAGLLLLVAIIFGARI